MKILSVLILLGAISATSATASSAIQPEIGVSYFVLRSTKLEPSPAALSVDEPTKFAPFVAVKCDATPWLGLRLSYHFLNDLHTIANNAVPTGLPLSTLPVTVENHYQDDVHLVSVAPEFTWSVAPQWTVAIAPQVNWVSSRGTISYSTNSPLLSLVAPRARNDDGFTLGGGGWVRWSPGARTTLSLGYHYLDLEPSFGREAHSFSGGVSWKF